MSLVWKQYKFWRTPYRLHHLSLTIKKVTRRAYLRPLWRWEYQKNSRSYIRISRNVRSSAFLQTYASIPFWKLRLSHWLLYNKINIHRLSRWFFSFGLFPPSPLPVRALRMGYGYPVAAVVINLCREKVHFTPPRFNSAVQTADCSFSGKENISAVPFAVLWTAFVLFSCKFLSSEDKICTKKRA